MGTFLNFVCPGVYIEQNAPRAVRSKARVWTERPARGAFYHFYYCVRGASQDSTQSERIALPTSCGHLTLSATSAVCVVRIPGQSAQPFSLVAAVWRREIRAYCV